MLLKLSSINEFLPQSCCLLSPAITVSFTPTTSCPVPASPDKEGCVASTCRGEWTNGEQRLSNYQPHGPAAHNEKQLWSLTATVTALTQVYVMQRLNSGIFFCCRKTHVHIIETNLTSSLVYLATNIIIWRVQLGHQCLNLCIKASNSSKPLPLKQLPSKLMQTHTQHKMTHAHHIRPADIVDLLVSSQTCLHVECVKPTKHDNPQTHIKLEVAP